MSASKHGAGNLSRRDFLATAAAVVGGTAAAGVMAGAVPVPVAYGMEEGVIYWEVE